MYGDSSILQRSKEHCILGIKGTLKRSEDTHFIHANCDTDLIMQESNITTVQIGKMKYRAEELALNLKKYFEMSFQGTVFMSTVNCVEHCPSICA